MKFYSCALIHKRPKVQFRLFSLPTATFMSYPRLLDPIIRLDFVQFSLLWTYEIVNDACVAGL